MSDILGMAKILYLLIKRSYLYSFRRICYGVTFDVHILNGPKPFQ